MSLLFVCPPPPHPLQRKDCTLRIRRFRRTPQRFWTTFVSCTPAQSWWMTAMLFRAQLMPWWRSSTTTAPSFTVTISWCGLAPWETPLAALLPHRLVPIVASASAQVNPSVQEASSFFCNRISRVALAWAGKAPADVYPAFLMQTAASQPARHPERWLWKGCLLRQPFHTCIKQQNVELISRLKDQCFHVTGEFCNAV